MPTFLIAGQSITASHKAIVAKPANTSDWARPGPGSIGLLMADEPGSAAADMILVRAWGLCLPGGEERQETHRRPPASCGASPVPVHVLSPGLQRCV